MILRNEYRYQCPRCRQPKRYQWHLYGHLVYQCVAGHSWLAWKSFHGFGKPHRTWPQPCLEAMAVRGQPVSDEEMVREQQLARATRQ